MKGITHIENFIISPKRLVEMMESNTGWDNRMPSRRTASFGKAQFHFDVNL